MQNPGRPGWPQASHRTVAIIRAVIAPQTRARRARRSDRAGANLVDGGGSATNQPPSGDGDPADAGRANTTIGGRRQVEVPRPAWQTAFISNRLMFRRIAARGTEQNGLP